MSSQINIFEQLRGSINSDKVSGDIDCVGSIDIDQNEAADIKKKKQEKDRKKKMRLEAQAESQRQIE